MAAVQNDHAKLRDLMEERLSDTDTDFYAVVDSQGNSIWTHGTLAMNYSSSKAVSTALEGNRGYAYEPFGTCAYGMVSAAPLFGENGNVVGAIIMGYSFANNLLVEQMKESYDVECTVFYGDLRVDTSLLGADGKKIVTRPPRTKTIECKLRTSGRAAGALT